MDRGFIFGDGVYEVVPLYGGRPFRFAEHMARLRRSLAAVRIPSPLPPEEWLSVIERLARSLPDERDLLAYLQVTRGVALRDHAMPKDIEPTVFAMVSRFNPVPEPARRDGVRCVTAADFRWEKANIKSTSLLGSVMARQISVDAGAAETIMFRHGYLSEAAASNVWIVRGGTVMGPPPDHLLLEGIRYGLIESLCREAGIAFELRRISLSEVFRADEVFLSSATREVLAVTRLDGQAIGSGRPGPIYDKLYALYQRAKQSGTPS
ncbi:D-amino acid aminotransferase [Ramlibacter rhizophilus]|uniref:D-amino acid aminotransferase n=2 Tax=Ramlibacter rhizophilus TaxID=1781167 RepID=A0A4Z0BD99_9BURK|nr:aminotransferase class IV [Ramlibacter rhizophilus]TFY96287.1 D-amino acid aminotransferase [Ramlibacter rhizophilus]